MAGAALLLALEARGAHGAEGVVKGTYDAVPVFEELPLNGAHRLTPYGDGFLVLDRFNHRLLELDGAGSLRRQIGQVGQAPGEMRFPMDYAIDGEGTIRIVASSDLFAVHSFSVDGAFLGVVRPGATAAESEAYSSFAVAADSEGGVWLNQPRQGALLTRYATLDDNRGTAVGDLLRPEDAFADCGQQSRCSDRRFSVRVNRVVLALAPEDSVVAAFTAFPLVRRYSANGDLKFQTRLRGDLVDELLGLTMKDPDTWRPHLGVNVDSDGINALTVVQSVAVEDHTGLVYCLVGGRELHVLSARDGKNLAILAPAGEDGGFSSVSIADGVAWLTRFSSMYRAELPASRNNWVDSR